jgi:hypothetical protein
MNRDIDPDTAETVILLFSCAVVGVLVWFRFFN